MVDSVLLEQPRAHEGHSSSEVALRYGENPHQSAVFYGELEKTLKPVQGKPLSYNNLLDAEAALELLGEWGSDTPTFVIIKHGNPCGVGQGKDLLEAFTAAYDCDPTSAFGGVLAGNQPVSLSLAKELKPLFYEALIAPDFAEEAKRCLSEKKARRVLRQVAPVKPTAKWRLVLGGLLQQTPDDATPALETMRVITDIQPSARIKQDLYFAYKVVKHVKSNGIVLAKGGRFLSAGVGHTSRIEALQFAIQKAQRRGFDLQGAVMASDAFFPFPDCVKEAQEAGIVSVIQPGGSKNDEASIRYCNQHGMSMLFSGRRHFKH